MATGRQKLALWLQEHGVSPEALGNRVGVSRQAVDNWLCGENPPRGEHPQLLELATSFAAEDAWDFVEPVRADDWSKADPSSWRRLRLVHRQIKARSWLKNRRDLLPEITQWREEAVLALAATSPGSPEHEKCVEKIRVIDKIATPGVEEERDQAYRKLLANTATLIWEAEQDVQAHLPAGTRRGDAVRSTDPQRYRAAVKRYDELKQALSDLFDMGT